MQITFIGDREDQPVVVTLTQDKEYAIGELFRARTFIIGIVASLSLHLISLDDLLSDFENSLTELNNEQTH